MGIRIVIDSTSDVTEEIIRKHNLKMVPLTVNFENESYLDKVELSSKDFFEKLGNSERLPTTSQVSPGAFAEAFSEILLEGDQVLGIFLASELSGTYDSARIAKDMIGSDNIRIMDSKSVCLGAFTLILKAIELVEQNCCHSSARYIEILGEGRKTFKGSGCGRFNSQYKADSRN